MINNEVNPSLHQEIQEIQQHLTLFEIAESFTAPYLILNEKPQVIYLNQAANCYPYLLSEFETNADGVLITSVKEAITSNQPLLTEITITAPDNKIVSFQLKVTPIAINNRRYALIALHDITSVKRRQVMDRNFYHDLINLTGGLSGYLEVVKDFEPEEVTEHLGGLKGMADEILDLTLAQREFNHAQQDTLELDVTLQNSTEFIDDLKEKMENHPSLRNRTLQVIVPENDFIFSTDLRLLYRILINMFKNAVEFTKKGGKVTFRIQEEPNSILFSIHNALEIGEQNRKNIFKFIVKEKGACVGTYAMKLYGENYLEGSVWYESQTQTGTTFYLRIPKRNSNEDLE